MESRFKAATRGDVVGLLLEISSWASSLVAKHRAARWFQDLAPATVSGHCLGHGGSADPRAVAVCWPREAHAVRALSWVGPAAGGARGDAVLQRFLLEGGDTSVTPSAIAHSATALADDSVTAGWQFGCESLARHVSLNRGRQEIQRSIQEAKGLLHACPEPEGRFRLIMVLALLEYRLGNHKSADNCELRAIEQLEGLSDEILSARLNALAHSNRARNLLVAGSAQRSLDMALHAVAMAPRTEADVGANWFHLRRAVEAARVLGPLVSSLDRLTSSLDPFEPGPPGSDPFYASKQYALCARDFMEGLRMSGREDRGERLDGIARAYLDRVVSGWPRSWLEA